MITILIVDDEKLERRGIRFLLKREGDFQILEAANGKDALGILASNHVDILFSDGKDALHERTGTDKSSKRRSSGYGNRDFQRI